ncbi:MAG: glycosyltransferase family 2 protein [Pseudomonadales bacterium]|nr:glycosyltransferase family 2 protein [Pseudomonadales bacterium]
MKNKNFAVGQNVTAIVITHNEEINIEACLACLRWCKHVLVFDAHSSDKTVQLSEKYGAVVVMQDRNTDFAQVRSKAALMVETPWLIYIDADERVSPTLAKEICENIENSSQYEVGVLALPRRNICYGSELKYGGWNNDVVERVFKKDVLHDWVGEIHESPIYDGQKKVLKNKLLHLTHRNTAVNLRKSADWTPIEAQLLVKGLKKPITRKTILRKGIMEFYRRYFKKKGHKDGMTGFVESLVQAMNRMMVYIQVWELQCRPSLTERYRKKDDEMLNLWKEYK